MTEERTEHFSVLRDTEDDIIDAETHLYAALRNLHDYRRDNERGHLLDAEIAIERAYCAVHDEIRDTTPEGER